MSHTYAVLEVTPMAFAEIRGRLERAGYQHAFHDDVIDLHGIAIKPLGAPSAVGIEVASILSQRTKHGMVELVVAGERIQMDLDKAREVHAMLGGAIEAAISDQLLYTFLTTQCDFSDQAAYAALLDFRELRQGTREVVRPM